jgi:toxin-antitoxin system PIN domain toxin
LTEPGYLFDTNVWVALLFHAHPLHAVANAALIAATPECKAWFCRSTQQSFLRLTSSENIARGYGIRSISNREAFVFLESFMQRPNVGFRDEPPALLPRWKSYADLTTSSPKRWMDAYLAAFAVEAGLQFVSCDMAFKAFADLPLRSLV